MKIEQKRIALFCDILRALVPECRLMITESGISVLAVDTANVGMVSVRLPYTCFEEFGIHADGKFDNLEVGMDVEKWKTAIALMKAAPLTITQDPSTKKITFSDGLYTYTHVPLDPTTIRKRPTIPGIQLPAAIAVDAKELAETIRAMGVVGDKVRIRSRGDNLVLDTEGDTDRLQKDLNGETVGKIITDPVSSLFSLDYLREVTKVMRMAGKITVCCGQDHPIRFDFEIDGMECSYLLAPRIESDGGQ
jgi:proliferating cell nuclear antigen